MCLIKVSTVEEKKSIENELKKALKSKKLDIFTCEGLSINSKGVNLFERFEFKEKLLDDLIQKYKNNKKIELLRYIVALFIKKELYSKIHYQFISKLLKKEKIYYNFILHSKECSKFLWLKLKFDENSKLKIEKTVFNSCKELSNKIFNITQKQESKKFRKSNYLKCIDNCLRDNNTPYPGNFDGIIFDTKTLQPKFIIEYSKVEWVYKFNKDINYHLKWYCKDKNKKEWKRDTNRWHSLKDLSNLLNIPVYIIWWGTAKEEFAIGELIEINNCCNKSIKIIKNKISKSELFNFFNNQII